MDRNNIMPASIITYLAASITFIILWFFVDGGMIGVAALPYMSLMGVVAKIASRNFVGNIIAWILMFFLAALPYIIAKRKSTKLLDQYKGLIITFCVVIFIGNYGYLNNWFMHPAFLEVGQENVIKIISAMALSVMFALLTLLVLYFFVFRTMESENSIIALFRKFLVMVALGTSILTAAVTVQMLLSAETISFVLIVDIAFYLIVRFAMIALIPKTIALLDNTSVGLFDVSNRKILKAMSDHTRTMILISIILPLIGYTLKFLLMRYMNNVHFETQVPILELFIAFTVTLFSKYISASIDVAEENKLFI